MKKKRPPVDLKRTLHKRRPGYVYLVWLIGVIFLVVSIRGIMNPHLLATGMFKEHIVPAPLINVAALLIISLQFIGSVTVLFMPRWRRAGLWILVVLMMLSTGAADWNQIRRLNTVCCSLGFYERMGTINYWMFIRNLSIITAALYYLEKTHFTGGRTSSKS